MSCEPLTIVTLAFHSRTGGPAKRLIFAAAVAFFGSTSAALAVQYDFLSVTGNNIGGNLASTTFTSDYTSNSIITVTHNFSSPAAVGAQDNQNILIFPSQFQASFPGTGQVQGHLAQTRYADPNCASDPCLNRSIVTFDLTGYKPQGSLPDLVFGIWNTTDEVPLPVYNVKIFDGTNTLPPTSFVTLYNQDNETQPLAQADHIMQLNTATGDITAPTPTSLFPNGTHTDAIFFKGIPVGTEKIIVTGNLPPLNLNAFGDGVGYYFAEIVPEPTSFVMVALGLFSLGVFGRRHSR